MTGIHSSRLKDTDTDKDTFLEAGIYRYRPGHSPRGRKIQTRIQSSMKYDKYTDQDTDLGPEYTYTDLVTVLEAGRYRSYSSPGGWKTRQNMSDL